jgi:hypothetical protein
LDAGSIVEGESTEASQAAIGIGRVKGLAVGNHDHHALVVDELETGKALAAGHSRLHCAIGNGVGGRGCGSCGEGQGHA